MDHAGAVGDDLHLHGLRQAGQQRRQLLLDLADRGEHVGAGLAHDVEYDRRPAIVPGTLFDVLRGLGDLGHVAHQHRRAVLIRDHRVQIVLGILDLVVVVDGVIQIRPVEIPLRLTDIDVAEQSAQIVDIESIGRQFVRVRFDPDRRHIAAGGGDLADPRHLGDLRGEAVVGHILQLSQRHRVGGDRQSQDGLIGGIDLGIDRRRRQPGRQQAVGGVDGLLHILFGDVEIQGKSELQSDHRGSGGARGGHLRKARNFTELYLQRRGHRGRHHLGTGAGVEGLHLNGRIVDVRQRRNRQEAHSHQPHEDQRDHQQ